MKLRTGVVSLLFVVLCVQLALAQGTCPDIVNTALEQASAACVDLGRNQACYGNINLEAQPRDGVSNFSFRQQGDIVNLVDVQHLTLDAMDVTNNTWGIALLKLQSNLPDTAPGQNVTMVMFGNVDIQAAQVTVSASNNANVRAAPTTTDEVVGSIDSGENIPADGRLEDSSWLRVRLSDGTEGWVRADLVTTTGDIVMLPIVTADDEPFTPLQAFYFATGLGDAPCEEAPDSGILIQSPQGVGEIELTVNGVDIALGSTAYLQAQPGTSNADGQMTVSIIEGQGVVETAGVSVTVPAGTQTTIPLDENGIANGAPQEPVPYDGAALLSLPITLLPETFTIAGVSIAEATAEATSMYTTADLVEGEWTGVVNVQFNDCPDPYVGAVSLEFTYTYDAEDGFINVTPEPYAEDDPRMTIAAGFVDVGVAFEIAPVDPLWTFNISAPTSVTITFRGWFPDSLTCTYPVTVTLTAVE
jgi:hypothetical protein